MKVDWPLSLKSYLGLHLEETRNPNHVNCHYFLEHHLKVIQKVGLASTFRKPKNVNVERRRTPAVVKRWHASLINTQWGMLFYFLFFSYFFLFSIFHFSIIYFLPFTLQHPHVNSFLLNYFFWPFQIIPLYKKRTAPNVKRKCTLLATTQQGMFFLNFLVDGSCGVFVFLVRPRRLTEWWKHLQRDFVIRTLECLHHLVSEAIEEGIRKMSFVPLR